MARTRRTRRTGPIYAANYARQSLTRDGSESRENQIEVGIETAARHGLEIVATLIEPESTSAYKNRGKDRPRWKELLELVRSGTVQAVVVYKTDRVSRGGGPGWAPLLEAAEAAGLDLDYFIYTPSGPMQEFEINIRATMDHEESKKTGDRVADMKYRQARAGIPNGGGRKPFGYVDPNFSQVDPEEAAILCEVRDRVLAGEGMQTVAKDLNRRGHRTVAGALWTGQHLGRIVRGPHLAGLRKVTEPYLNAEGNVQYRTLELVQGTWPAIYTVDDHEKLNAVKGVQWTKDVKRHLLTGILTCSTCGSKMQSKPHSKWGLRYECRRRSKQMTGENLTGCVTITALDAEYVVKEAILKRLDSPVVRAELSSASQTTTGKELTKKLLATKARLDEATDDYYADPPRISRAQFLKASETLNKDIEELSARISRQRVTLDIPNNPEAIRKAYDDGDLEFRRSLISVVVSHVIIHPAKPQGQAELPIIVPGKPAGGRPVDAARIEPIWRG